ncbi:hypothetical protein ACH9EU_06845 [Kocuria sp. M1R5S2]|uniref:hypothetical protein n=1 Tax=Kocuria rhizosphaerae TaxID=3376285 RepID=UPI0037984025
MTSTDLTVHARLLRDTLSASGLCVDRFEIVDDVAELGLSFRQDALAHALASELTATGGPADWEDPDAPLDEGSPTWAYAAGIAALLHHGYFNQVILARHEQELEDLLAEHGHAGIPVTATAAYGAADLMPVYRQLKARHLGQLQASDGEDVTPLST